MAMFDQQVESYPERRWNPYGGDALDAAQSRSTFLNGVYRHMALGLGVTGLVAMWAASTPDIAAAVAEHPFVLIIAQFGLVIGMSAFINKISAAAAMAMFYAYAALTGLFLSTLFFIFTQESIAATFFVTGGTFGAMSLYGYVTKTDLSRFGNFLFMGLIGVVIASVVNMFWANSVLSWMVTYIGLFVFIGLTAYDTQRIKRMAYAADGSDGSKKTAIFGALMLYLDFINMFILMLRILGRRR